MTIERLNRLLFELSSTERIDMMLELKKKSLRLSEVSRKMDLTVTESSRHLQRLREAKMIQKDTEGYFSVSPFGDLILSLISPLNFVTKNQKYFLEYDISPLPCEFVSRMGELLEGEIGGAIFSNLEYLEQELRKADKFIWIQTDQIFKNLIPIVAEKIKQPFDFRFISPQEVMPPDSKAPLPSTTPNVKKRSSPKVDIVIVVTEKTAGFCLPDRNGKLDYRNLHGNDPKFLKWCRDLFLYYWERAKPVSPYK